MLASAAKHPEHKIVAWYVHDYESEEWLDATTAFYVFSDNIHSPMGSSATAHATRAAAEATAAELDGEVLDWQGLRDRFDAGKLMMGMGPAAGSETAADPGAMAGHQHGAQPQTMTEAGMGEVILGETEVNGYRLQLISHGPLQAGYNQVMLHATAPDGAPAEGLEFTYMPVMSMMDGKSHTSPVVNPVATTPGMYHGAVVFSMPDGPDLGDWSLTVTMTDPAAGSSGETTFPVDVAPSKLIGSFVAPDESKLFVAVIQPMTPTVGVQPMELLVFRRESMMDWPLVDDVKLGIVPEMPTMGHGSTGNENPVAAGAGRYLGQVPWTVTTTVSQDETPLGEVVFEFEVR